MNFEHYRRGCSREQELLERLGRDVETARDAHDDQADPGDLAHVDELKDEYRAGRAGGPGEAGWEFHLP